MKDYFASISSDGEVDDDKLTVTMSGSMNAFGGVSPGCASFTIPEELASMPIMDLIGEAMRCIKDYKVADLQEKTERRQIAAQLQAITDQINAQKEIHLKDMDRKFIEDMRIIDIVEQQLAIASERHDNEMRKSIYNLLLSMYEKSVESSEARLQAIGPI